MYVGRDFSPQEAGESEVFGFDFINDFDPDEIILQAVWTMKLAQGVDSNPNRLRGVPFIVIPIGGTTKTGTIHRVGGLIAGCTYILHVNVLTSLGNNRSLWSHVRGITDELQ